MISVVIRSKNEERWIGRCLESVIQQDHKELEIVLVDNDSTDRTLEIAERYPCKIVLISDEEFSFGRSLNRGIQATTGDHIAILSAHCIAAHEKWLERLWVGFADPRVAAVYGRQEPLPDSSPFDKRDLWTTFGPERRLQTRDFFFHNANSMVRRDVWVNTPFDESLHGVEDRDWARKVIARGYAIAYEPTASVYHFHGIHHGRNEERAKRVVKVIELLNHAPERGIGAG